MGFFVGLVAICSCIFCKWRGHCYHLHGVLEYMKIGKWAVDQVPLAQDCMGLLGAISAISTCRSCGKCERRSISGSC